MTEETGPITHESLLVPEAEAAPIQEINPEADTLAEEMEALVIDEEDTGEVEAEPEVEPLPPPVSWSKEDAEAFKELPRAAQEVITRREAERDNFVRAKGREAATIKQQIENQAREIIAQQAEQHAQSLRTWLTQNAPQPADERLLYSQDPNDVVLYHRQDAAYRRGIAQYQQVQQEIAQSQQQAMAAKTEAQQLALAAEAQRLQQELPEWFDPSAGPKLQAELQSIGAELGYPEHLMAEANANDILALRKAAEWKAKAEKFDKLQGQKMEAVRAAKGMPKMARPGASAGKAALQVTAQGQRQAALTDFANTRSGEAAAALLLTRT